MLTWEIVRDRLRRFISDQVVDGRAPRVSDQELVDAWTDAQDDLVLYVARPGSFTVPADVQRAQLPDDLYRVDVVSMDHGDDENHYTMVHLDALEPDDVNIWEGNYWYLTHNNIEFTGDALEHAAKVYYRAYFPAPSIDNLDMPIFVPRWAIQACVYYASAQCIEKQTVADPQLRQYAARRQDAGNPTSNPFLQVAEYLMKRYRERVYDRIQDTQNERVTWPSSYR